VRTQFTIQGMVTLSNGTTALTGSVNGPHLTSGQRSVLVTPTGPIEVEILGVGVGDPNLEQPNMQMVLGKIVKGDHRMLKGATLDFD
jgi:hypothetical protein